MLSYTAQLEEHIVLQPIARTQALWQKMLNINNIEKARKKALQQPRLCYGMCFYYEARSIINLRSIRSCRTFVVRADTSCNKYEASCKKFGSCIHKNTALESA